MAPRDGPSLSDVLAELGKSAEDDRDSIRCLGLLILDGNCLLVNRSLLLSRLQALTSSQKGMCTHFGDHATIDFHEERFQNVVANARTAHQGISQKPAGRPDSSEAQHSRSNGRASISTASYTLGPENLQMIDVRATLPNPEICTSRLLPRLAQALRLIFEVAEEGGTVQSAAYDGEVEETQLDGRRRGWTAWLRDWELQEMHLSGDDVKDVLAGVGLSGLVGWLLEYPVIYCCPAVGNCLAHVPLRVYTVVFLLNPPQDDQSRDARREASSESGRTFDAMSFSLPAFVHSDGNVNDKEDVSDTPMSKLQRTVEHYVTLLRLRMSKYRSICGERCSLKGIDVIERQEMLSFVAL